MYLKIPYLEIFLIESDLSCMNGACQHVDAVIFHSIYFVILYRKRVFFPNDYVKRRLCIAPQMSCSTMPNSCCHGNVISVFCAQVGEFISKITLVESED